MNQYQPYNRNKRRFNWLGLVLLNLFVAQFTVILLDRMKNQPAYNMRTIAKRYANPWMLKIAGRGTNPQGIITHVGRKSGRIYSTPITPTPIPNGFIIALPYGTDVDWCRNILAAGNCTLQWHGTTYNLVKPQLVDAASIASSLPSINQAFLRFLKVTHVLKLELSTAPTDYATPAL
jgi:deazaflavin-dependent oxidoreductase (nitroreductase family)